MGPWSYIIIGVLIIALGTIVVGYGWHIKSEKEPYLSAECELMDSIDPTTLKCIIENSGNGEARDVLVSFEKMLPLGTKLISSPEDGLTLIEAQILPNPILDPTSAPLLTAFSIKIPRISSLDKVSFKITTTHPENSKAAKEVLLIHTEIVDVMDSLIRILSKKNLIDPNQHSIQEAKGALSKLENFFAPSIISYENGKQTIQFITDNEKKAWDDIGDLWVNHEPLQKEILDGRPTFKSPEVLIKTDEGESYYLIMPPYVSSTHSGKMSGKLLKEIMEKGLEALFIDKEQISKKSSAVLSHKTTRLKQSFIDEHNAVAKSYEDKHLYFVPLMSKLEVRLLPPPLKNIFKNKPVKLHQVEGGAIVSLYEQAQFFPNKQEWIDTQKGYWVCISPEFRRWQKDFHERSRDPVNYEPLSTSKPKSESKNNNGHL